MPSPNQRVIRTSKFLSKVLRHAPGIIGIALDESGWTSVDGLIAAANRRGITIDRELLMEVVATNDKRRFSLSEDGSMIRANQGHSVQVDLGLEAVRPPDVLYHGTADRFLASIEAKGLVAGRRHHVHLSLDSQTATKVGSRHGEPVVLTIDAARMWSDGHVFYCSANGVWLTDQVPVDYIRFGGAAAVEQGQVDYYLGELRRGCSEDAICSLRELGEPILPRLHDEFLKEVNADVRALLVEVAWQTRSPAAIPLLAEALADPQAQVWKEALNGLVAIKTPEAIAVMKAALRHEDADATRREWIAEAIDQAESASGNTDH